jgi:putative transposase
VRCPKYQRRVLGGRVASRLGELLEQMAGEYGWQIVAKEVPDHVHPFAKALWLSSFLVALVRYVSEPTVRRYIEQQWDEVAS